MSNLMKLLGLVLLVAGAAIVVLTQTSPGNMDVRGIKFDSGAIFLVGGILALGLAGVMDRLGRSHRSEAIAARLDEAPIVVPASVPNFGRKAAEATAATAAAAAAGAAMAETVKTKVTTAAPAAVQGSVADTISALEQAKADVIKSMGGMDAMTAAEPEPEPVHVEPVKAAVAQVEAAPVEAVVEVEDDGELFVVEEKVIRGRPARVLSDDTVEAETDEGWMRFENIEHLNEYLDSVEEQGA
jgi:hypothetical protein